LAPYDEYIRRGSTIILAVFGGLALSQAEKSGNNAGWLTFWPGEQCCHT